MVQLGSKERAQLIGIIAKAGEERAGREAVNKEPLCTGGPGTRPRLQPAARAKQTGTVWCEAGQADGRTETRPPLGESRSQGLSWELGAAQGVPAPGVESSPRWPRPSLHRARMVPSLIHARGRGQRTGWQSAADGPGQEMSDSPSATAIPRTRNSQSRKYRRKPTLPLKNRRQVQSLHRALARRKLRHRPRGCSGACGGGSSSCPRLGCSLHRKEK